MGKEIERKFLVRGTAYKAAAVKNTEIRQAYLNTDPDATVRVRIAGNSAFITVKSRNRGSVRGEWEYAIPVADAEAMLEQCAVSGLISKTRWLVAAGNGLCWEVDEFHGNLAPIVLAEIELPTETEPLPIPLPEFIGEEVTGNPDYYNSNLARGRS